MRTFLTLLAMVAFMSATTAQDVSTDKKSKRNKAKTEAAVTPAPEATSTDAAPKAGCCAGKSAAAKASCGSKAGTASTMEGKVANGAATTSTETTE
nr:hypothetical protein [Bacteroidota bacterium]